MIADASHDRGRFARPFDVCVVGSGPAGITLARRLAAAGATVALMEAGGLAFTPASQAIYEGETRGLDYFPLDMPRLRYFGGTSNHWAGWCRALDAIDFEAKPFNPLSGWPIAQIDLDPYRAEADAILDLPSATEAPDLALAQSGHTFHRIQFRWSPPTRFGPKYGEEIARSPRIHLVLNANLHALDLAPDGTAVTGARFRTLAPGDPGFAITARHYCLAAGGIENARLLLNFPTADGHAIGNRHDLVGRCFAEHPHFVLADLLLVDPPPGLDFYSPTAAFVAEHAVLNFGLRIEPARREPDPLASLARTPCDADFTLARRALEACAPRPMHRTPTPGTLRIAQEQAVNPASRVSLGDARDALGLRRAVLDWRLDDLDIHTMRTAAMAMATHLAEQNLGRARLRDWLLAEPARLPGLDADEVAGKHHMGTTRMAADPRHGVTDADARVHGLDNLHIAGSSLFSTSGHANPTYTIVQLALRLGDHLAARLAA
jgi:choline dehydrogenase-like flavoprotein